MFIKPDEPSLCSIAMQTTLIDCCDLQVCMLAIGSPVGGVVGHTSTPPVLPEICATGIVAPVTVNKNFRAKCPHGRLTRTRCAECLGHAVQWKNVKKCPHDLVKSRCEVSVGHPIMKKKQAPHCVHGRQKCRCVDCVGLCEHGIGKWRCVDCGATAPKPQKKCSHGRVRHRCKQCIGLCIHGIGKWRCVECGAAPKKAVRRCQHDKLVTSQCKECQILTGVIKKRIHKNCAHGIPRNTCKICGWYFCCHQKRRSLCQECNDGGSALCINCIHWPDPQQKTQCTGITAQGVSTTIGLMTQKASKAGKKSRRIESRHFYKTIRHFYKTIRFHSCKTGQSWIATAAVRNPPVALMSKCSIHIKNS